MSLPAHISRVALAVILDLLFPLLLAAAGSEEDARRGAMDMLAEHRPETTEELGLAAEVVAFRLQALDAMRDAARRGPLYASKLELMKVAATLRRSESAAQRKLDALQRARRAAAKKAEAEPQPDAPAEAGTAVPVEVHDAAPPAPLRAESAAPAEPAARAPVGAAAPASARGGMDAFVQQLAAEFVANGADPDETMDAITEMAKVFGGGLYGDPSTGASSGGAPATG